MQRLDNFSRFDQLRRDFPLFCYEAFHYETTGKSLEISFHFSLSEDIHFRPKISIPWKQNLFIPYENLSSSALDNLIFHMGMIELISYWKAACPQKVVIKPFRLTGEQEDFWKKLYYLGLGEFFHMNSIETNEEEFMHIVFEEKPLPSKFSFDPAPGSLLPVGGGKDSAVSAGLLNRWKAGWVPFVINPRGATREVLLAAGKSGQDTIVINREIDQMLLKLNGQGFLNGHTPFSALLAFYSLLVSYLTGRASIVLSNESSANEPTIPGTDINHQYSKSFGFEKDFRDYYNHFISPGFNYYSLLRPLSELQIARIFSSMPEYFSSFRSCNAGSKSDSWCGACPKCLFTFIILSPFLEPAQLENIFGKNLLNNNHLRGILDELTGIAKIKPFDCIGTVEEVNMALDAAMERYDPDNLPVLLQYYKSTGNSWPEIKVPLENITAMNETAHFVPSEYNKLLHRAIS